MDEEKLKSVEKSITRLSASLAKYSEVTIKMLVDLSGEVVNLRMRVMELEAQVDRTKLN